MISGLHRVPIPGLSNSSALPANLRLAPKSIYFNETGILLGGTTIAVHTENRCRRDPEKRRRTTTHYMHCEAKLAVV
jgi:hypothetical protein